MYDREIILAALLVALSVTTGERPKFGHAMIGRLSGESTGVVDRKTARSVEVVTPDATNVNILDYPSVNSTSGNILGITTDVAHAFYEVPYAEPPVGSLRFQDPQPLTYRISEINATTNNNLECIQYCIGTSNDSCLFNEAEDCLVLNIFVSRSVKFDGGTLTDLLPVMFYIHGGSFKFNSGTDRMLDGKELANVTNSVVVVPNYRLGVLGFLVHKEMGQSDLTGNQGLKDQRLALQWVQDNIAQFGGDKTRVMIFGNSAGAQSVLFHTVSEQSAPLYYASIQQSNPHIYSLFYPDVNTSLRITGRVLQVLGCNSSVETERECLQNADPGILTDLMQAVEGLTVTQEGSNIYIEETFLPVIDGVEFTDTPENLYRDGKWNKDKPSIMGIVAQELEETQFSFPKNGSFGEALFFGLNILEFGTSLAQVIVNKYKDAFPPGEGEDYRITYGKELSHLFFDCPNRLMARYASNTTSSSVYFYVASHPGIEPSCVAQNEGNVTGCRLASHATEVPYVFRTVERDDNYIEEDGIIEDEYSTYWGSFARTGDPSNNLETPLRNVVNWLEYKADTWLHLHITTPTSELQTGFNDDICNFWDSVNYGRDGFQPEPTSETAATTQTTTTQGGDAASTAGQPTAPNVEPTSQTAESTTNRAVTSNYTFSQIMICLGFKVIWDSFVMK